MTDNRGLPIKESLYVYEIHQDSPPPKTFRHLFGISVVQFDVIFQKVAPKWGASVISGYKRPGGDYRLDLSDMILMLLLYDQSYMRKYFWATYLILVCGIIKVLEPILAGVMAQYKGEKNCPKIEVEIPSH